MSVAKTPPDQEILDVLRAGVYKREHSGRPT
jgi:hypothetical protein